MVTLLAAIFGSKITNDKGRDANQLLSFIFGKNHHLFANFDNFIMLFPIPLALNFS